MTRTVLVAVLVSLGAALFVALPPRTRRFDAAVGAGATAPVRGAFHVHTSRSDGTGSVDEVAAAARRAGLRFVVLTDHGDGTRLPDRPRYRDGVLTMDAVEISTTGGHVIALGMPVSPYPLGGEARDVLEDVARLGGFAIAAHPGSTKPELRWVEWPAPFDGLEWLNGDSEWRDESAWTLARVLFTYPLRRPEALASVLDRPEDTLRRWDALTRRRRVVALAGADAHARVGLRSFGEPYDNSASLHVPSYEQTFRAFAIALPDLALGGDAAADAAAIVAAIRAGHVYSTVDGLATPAALSFAATSRSGRAVAGDVLPMDAPFSLRVDVQADPDAQIELLKDGARIATRRGGLLQHTTTDPGVYRVEVLLPGAPGTPPVPWILSNPIYLGRDMKDPRPAPRRAPSEFAVQYDNGPADAWRIESNARAIGEIDVAPAVDGTQIAMRYALGGAASASPYVALVMPAGPALATHDRLMFTARADRPMRVSVQLRAPSGPQGERWHRSVYLDTMPRDVAVYFDDVAPLGVTSRRRPDLSRIDSVLFVVDTVNTPLGAGGQVWLDEVRYAR